MERSKASEAVVALGKQLVASLKLGDSGDTLGRWMAHYVAELIDDLETASHDNRPAKQVELRDAVLALWEHRFALPNGTRPFAEFEAILRAMASLDPESQSHRYFSSHHVPEDNATESKETKRWLELASGLDRTARMLISHCLVSAAGSALDRSMEWVTLAENAEIYDSFEFRVVRLLANQNDLMNEPNPNEQQLRILQDRYEKLEVFRTLADSMAKSIKARIDSIAESHRKDT